MSAAGKILRGGVAAAVLSTLLGSLTAPAAHADWHDRRGWHEHEHERGWRGGYGYGRGYGYGYGHPYYYGRRVYVAPPVVYGPPPPPPGIGLFFGVR
jgi:hypothetical protein